MKKKKRKAALLVLIFIFASIVLYRADTLYYFFAEWDDNLGVMLDSFYTFRTKNMDFMGIHWVAKHGQAEAAGRIIQKNPKLVNDRDYLGRTPLLLAVASGHLQTVYVLLEGGADITTRDYRGRDCFDYFLDQKTAGRPGQFDLIYAELLQWRARRVNDEYIKLKPIAMAGDLRKFRAAWDAVPVDLRAEIFKFDNYQYYPGLLKIAAEQGHADICFFLIAQGDDPYRASIHSPSAIYLAAKNGRLEVVKTLLANGFNREVTDGPKNNPVLAAYSGGHLEVVRALIHAGVNPFPTFENGRTIFHEAVLKDQDDLAWALLGHPGGTNLQDKDGRTPLFFALYQGKIDLAKAMLKQYADPTLFDREWLLIRAAQRGEIEVLELILTPTDQETNYENKTPVDINGRSSLGFSALHAAALSGQGDAVKYLLERGADIEARRTREGATPLHGAAGKGNLEILELLLEHNANVNARDNFCLTPLAYAASQGQLEAIKILVKRGAWVDVDDARPGPGGGAICESPFAPLAVAAAGDRREAVELLLDLGSQSINARFNVGPDNDNGAELFSATVLHVAVARRNSEMVRLLLERGADPNARGCDLLYKDKREENLSPLQLALLPGGEVNGDVVRELLDHGARPEERDAQGRTPLMDAASRGAASAVLLLLEKGVSVKARDNEGRTALHWFALSRDPDQMIPTEDVKTAEVLLLHGLNVNSQDREGNAPLHIAVRNADYFLIKLLSEYGAKPNLRNRAGLTPLLLIGKVDYRDRHEALGFLIKQGGDINAEFPDGETLLLKAAKANDPWRLGDYLAYDPDVHIKISTFTVEGVEFSKSSFLHLAAAQYHSSLTELCIKAGFDVNARDSQGNTPLHMAAMFNYNRGENIAPLIKAGADLNAKNKSGLTPLHLLAKNWDYGLIETFIEYGPQLNARDNEGKTPLHWLVPALEDYRSNHDDEFPLASLLAKGVDPCIKDNSGKTPLDLARDLNNADLITRLSGLCHE